MARFVLKDTFYKKAKQEGFRARSAYKLQEIQKKFHIIKKDDKVLDLGCAPGSWLQVIAGIVGPGGKASGIDVLPLQSLPEKNITTITADIRNIDVQNLLARFSIPSFDVITCDIAPNLSGIREVDDKNVSELYEAVRRLVTGGLKTGGSLILKSFFTGTFKEIKGDLDRVFKGVSVFKPASSRNVSSEVYLVCQEKTYTDLQSRFVD